jgi:hypothetical protein
MSSLVESAAIKAVVPIDVLDLIERDFISQVIEELTDLLLPPIKGTLKERDIMRELK